MLGSENATDGAPPILRNPRPVKVTLPPVGSTVPVDVPATTADADSSASASTCRTYVPVAVFAFAFTPSHILPAPAPEPNDFVLIKGATPLNDSAVPVLPLSTVNAFVRFTLLLE